MDSIRELLDTYDISEIFKGKIEVMARKVQKLGPETFGNIDEYIAHIVETHSMSYAARTAIHFSGPVHPESQTTFHNFETSPLQAELQDEDGIPLEKAADVLTRLPYSPNIQLVADLLEGLNGMGSRIVVDSSTDKILERINAACDAFANDGRLILPRRPIKRLSLRDGVEISFIKRFFKGNSLEYLKDNIGVYSDMGGQRLSRFDKPLYNALRRHGQLKEAYALIGDDPGLPYEGDPYGYLQAHPDDFKDRNLKDDRRMYRALSRQGTLKEGKGLIEEVYHSEKAANLRPIRAKDHERQIFKWLDWELDHNLDI